MSLLVFCPTRGRPAAAQAAWESFVATKQRDDTALVFVVDDDDESGYGAPLPVLTVPRKGSMNGALQEAVDLQNASNHSVDYFGFIGDDHRFRTPGWDERILSVLEDQGGGFAYANDLYQGVALPTQVFVNSSIVKALGWFGLRGAKHLYLDNTWKILGDAADCLFFFPDVVIEHMHPAVGKADWDEAYKRVNAPEMYNHDRVVYEEWLASGFDEDIKRVRRALSA